MGPHEIENVLASEDERILQYKGENYYKACGEFVSNLPDGGKSFCVKRKGHPTDTHEDFEGREKNDWDLGLTTMPWAEAIAFAMGAVIESQNIPDTTAIESRVRAIRKQLIARIQQAGPIYG